MAVRWRRLSHISSTTIIRPITIYIYIYNCAPYAIVNG